MGWHVRDTCQVVTNGMPCHHAVCRLHINRMTCHQHISDCGEWNAKSLWHMSAHDWKGMSWYMLASYELSTTLVTRVSMWLLERWHLARRVTTVRFNDMCQPHVKNFILFFKNEAGKQLIRATWWWHVSPLEKKNIFFKFLNFMVLLFWKQVLCFQNSKTCFTTVERRLVVCFRNKIMKNKNKKKHENRKQFQPVFGNRFLFSPKYWPKYALQLKCTLLHSCPNLWF